jgi:hypothetical protein
VVYRVKSGELPTRVKEVVARFGLCTPILHVSGIDYAETPRSKKGIQLGEESCHEDVMPKEREKGIAGFVGNTVRDPGRAVRRGTSCVTAGEEVLREY